jgi:hypothetical protein
MPNFIKINLAKIISIVVSTCFFVSLVMVFLIQFKVDSLKENIEKTNSEISAYQDKIQLLEVQWVYLTRPERLRNLSNQYLKKNDYILASQIKKIDEFEKYHLANLEKIDKNQESAELIKVSKIENHQIEKINF